MMKLNTIFTRMIIKLSFYLHTIIAFLFVLILVLVVILKIFFEGLSIPVGYLFWFVFGMYCFSLLIRKATSFLHYHYNKENEYYLSLLARKKKKF